MSNVSEMPMSWATAMRLVALEIGVAPETFDEWVTYARTLGEVEGERWLSDQMDKAVRKKIMWEDSP